MAKRLVIGLIFLCMTLHSASRVGLLSYVYQQRHEIAFTLGLIAEKPIAMCNSDYDFNGGLTIKTHDEDSKALPPLIIRAQEIHLFVSTFNLDLDHSRTITETENFTAVIEQVWCPPSLDILNPPS